MITKVEHAMSQLRGAAVGVDECNYSPSLAGDCVVAACWLPLDRDIIFGIDDSKRLTHGRRLQLFAQIVELGVFTVVPASPADVGHFGIFIARNIAAATAVEGLKVKLALLDKPLKHVLTDKGMAFTPKLSSDIDHISLTSADRFSYLVGAASIVAKTYIDALFEGYNVFWPGYQMNKNHGSSSDIHYEALCRKGPSPVHRIKNYGSNWWHQIRQRAEGKDRQTA